MAAIKINGKTVQNIYKGADEVKAIYKGNVKVWERVFNIDKFHTLCPAATATKVTFDYTSAQDLTALTFCGWVDLAETIGVYNSGTEYFVLSDSEIRPKSCRMLFYEYSALLSIIFNNFILSDCNNVLVMFYNCSGLTALDVSGFDTSAVTAMNSMFSGCSKLKTVNISAFDVSNVTSFNRMFFKCSVINNLDFTKWNTSNVTDMQYMFESCSYINNLDLSSWNTSNVTKMGYMFDRCIRLTNLKISNWDVRKVTSMRTMFQHLDQIKHLDLSGWITSSLTDMEYMFNSCGNILDIDLTNFDTSKINIAFTYTFENCKKLVTIYMKNNPVVEKSHSGTFNQCTAIVGGNGTTYKSGSSTYFRIDTPETPGYLTLKTA